MHLAVMTRQACPEHRLAVRFGLGFFFVVVVSQHFFLAVTGRVVKSMSWLFRRVIAANLHGCEQDHHSFMSEEAA